MKMDKLISVIMPIYNTSDYLDCAVQCIINQIYDDWELICINDGSTDESMQIVSKLALRDSRIRVYENDTNKGAAYTRNKGLKFARGEYILFVDSDDVFERDMLQTLYQTAEKTQADVVYMDYDSFGEESDLSQRGRRKIQYYFDGIINDYLEDKLCTPIFLNRMKLAPYGRFCRKDFLLRNGIEFQDLASSNDVYFSIMTTFLAGKMVCLDSPYYFLHVRNHGGAFRISNNRNPYNNFKTYQYICSEMEKRRIWDANCVYVRERFLFNTLYELRKCNQEKAKEYVDFLKQIGFRELGIWESCEKFSFEGKALWAAFNKKDIASGWYKKHNAFQELLIKNASVVAKMFAGYLRTNKKCAIWGAGNYGRIMADFCKINGCELEGFIDNNDLFKGTYIQGYQIYKPEEIIDAIDVVIITNQKYFNDIYDQITGIKCGVEMVSLELLLIYGMDAKEVTVETGESQ